MNCLRRLKGQRVVLLLVVIAEITRHTIVAGSSEESTPENIWRTHGTYSYLHASDSQTWDNAKQQCKNNDGQLVTILNQDEQNFIKPSGGSYWIGLQGNVDTGVYEWFNGRGISAFSSFHEDGVSGSADGTTVCVKIVKSGEWKIDTCTTDKKYICKRPVCSDGQRLQGNAASKGDCLVHILGSYTWSEARTQCKALEGDTDLASPNDNEFKNFLQNNFANNADRQNFWLGARVLSSGGMSLLSGQTTTFSANDRDETGGDCIAWLNQNDDFERHGCEQLLGAVCQRSTYYADYGNAPDTQISTTTQAATTMVLTTKLTTQKVITSAQTTEPPTTTKAETTPAQTTTAETTVVSAATTSPATTVPNKASTTPGPTTATASGASTSSAETTAFQTNVTTNSTTKYELQGILDSLNQSASDENLDAAANWVVANPTVPDNVNDLENYAQRFLKVCSIMIHNNHTSYWKNSDAPVEVSSLAGSCSSVIDDLAKSSDSDQVIITDNVVATTKVFAKTSEFSNIEVDLFNGTEVSISKDDFEQLGIDEDKKISVSIVSYKYGELLTGSNDDEGPVSGVVSITLFADGEKTSLPVSFTLTTDKARVESSASEEEPTCMYQDTDSNGEITWKSDGCSVSGIEDDQVTCQCQHTTNFAVLMQVKEVKLAERDVVALDWITRICCSLSIVALVVTLAVLLFLRSLLRSERVTIHTNLVVALIMAQMLLLVSGLAAANERACRAVAILMHYFFTAVFCWMLVEGGHLYLQIVRVFSAGKDRLRTYLAIGWGTPLLIVLITAASRWYGYGANGNCWLSTAYGMVWAFVGPALLIIAVNFVILIMVLRILVISAKSKSDGEYDHIKAGVKGALLLLPLLGTTWLFGVISFSADTVVFLYLFAIFNSLQGVFIFFLYCIFNSEVRNAFTRQKEKRALTRGEMDSTSTNMSGSDPKSKSSNRIYPDMTTKNTQVLDIKSTTTTTTHTKMVIEAHSPDMPEFDDDPPQMASEVD